MKLYISIAIAALVVSSLALCRCSSDGSGDGDEGRVLYVDSVSGSDDHDGLTEQTAWKTAARVNSFSLQPGDTVRFRRGQTFEGGLLLAHSGTAQQPIVFDAYGEGDRPVLLGSKVTTGWIAHSGTIHRREISHTPGVTGAGIVIEDGTPLAFRSWNSSAESSLGADKGVFTYDPADLTRAVLYIRCSDESNPSTHTIEAGHHLFGVRGENVSNIRIRNLHFKNFSCHGAAMRSCSGIAISDCVAENIGGAVLALSPALLYGGNGFEFTLNSANCSISGSTAMQIFDSGFSPQVFESNTATRDVLIENCVARKCGFAGIEISVLRYGGSSGERIENIRVVSCDISESGAGWSGVRYGNEGHGIRVNADTGAGSMDTISIEHTAVRNCENAGIYIGGEAGTVDISRSLIQGNRAAGIKCNGLSGVATLRLCLTSSLVLNHDGASSIGVGYNVVNGNGLELAHNTFVGNRIGLYVGSCGGEAAIRNNVWYSSSTSHTHLYAAAGFSPAALDYNCYHEHGGSIIGWEGSAYASVSAFSGARSWDSHSIGADPLFENAASDWRLTSASPCKNAGTAAAVWYDCAGALFHALTPSMGAYQ